MIWNSIKNLIHRLSSVFVIVIVFVFVNMTSCIEPPLHLPGEEVEIQVNTEVTTLEMVWSVSAEWKTDWHFGWDADDEIRWGSPEYPKPDVFDVRRFYTGNVPYGPHKADATDKFSVNSSTFRKQYLFGYYDMLIWNDIQDEDGVVHVVVDESDIENTTAHLTREYKVNLRGEADDPGETYLYNQPEIMYSSYPRAIHISDDIKEYDYYNKEENVWVKHVNCVLQPIVYIYLVQVIIYNNDNTVDGVTGEGALSGLAISTSVNTGHTSEQSCTELLNTHMKKGLTVNGKKADIIGTKLTTFGLCGMKGLSEMTDSLSTVYEGTCPDNKNYLYIEMKMSNGKRQTMRFDITDQMKQKCRGGVITIEIDNKVTPIPDPDPESGTGTVFDPVIEDYEDEDHDILI